jgi:hypothetical protein
MSVLGGGTVLGGPAVVKKQSPAKDAQAKEEKKDVVASAVAVAGGEVTKKKKKKKKNKKKQPAGPDEKKTITLTRFDKESKSHKQFTVPLVTVERSSSGTEDEDESDEGLLGYRKVWKRKKLFVCIVQPCF